jgi:hypothetical protein
LASPNWLSSADFNIVPQIFVSFCCTRGQAVRASRWLAARYERSAGRTGIEFFAPRAFHRWSAGNDRAVVTGMAYIGCRERKYKLASESNRINLTLIPLRRVVHPDRQTAPPIAPIFVSMHDRLQNRNRRSVRPVVRPQTGGC